METFIGHIKSPEDALIIFEACRKGMLNRVQRRLTSKERMNIQSGSVFAWDEREAGMRRWTDGRTWSPSRVLGSFLTYRELDTKRRPRRPSASASGSKQISFSYKHDGLIKQSFSICTAANQKIHLISYYTKADVISGRLRRPSSDLMLSKITIPKGLYPELNPLDMGGGHTASFHSIHSYQQHNVISNRQNSVDSALSRHSDDYHISSPPSLLSSSPESFDEDCVESLPSIDLPTTNLKHVPPQLLLHSLPSVMPPIMKDVSWDRLPFSEDQRQLNALRDQLRI
ncbi:hypothetical protein K501DRAFT_289372 [Backusella circina FSU 941]|nr:hypothetical protein K501DRAFT_289372 [Backusella circina FSU 941]